MRDKKEHCVSATISEKPRDQIDVNGCKSQSKEEGSARGRESYGFGPPVGLNASFLPMRRTQWYPGDPTLLSLSCMCKDVP